MVLTQSRHLDACLISHHLDVFLSRHLDVFLLSEAQLSTHIVFRNGFGLVSAGDASGCGDGVF